MSGTAEALPPTRRWTARRKAEVLAAVRSGKITMEEIMRRYQLTEEEFFFWQRAFEARGPAGLKATRLQEYRGLRTAVESAMILSFGSSAELRPILRSSYPIM